VTCSATDAAGNTGTNTFTVEVQDVTKPIVTVPVDQTVEATGANGATVTYSGVNATDDVDGTLTARLPPGLRHRVPARHHDSHLLGPPTLPATPATAPSP